ncbi:MAG: large-conductance mechanosensitive channel protein MscL [Bacteroidales bacterium]|nr:large-conductance mechanosensitive channel protein MscL [Bacteroidales bacterium]
MAKCSLWADFKAFAIKGNFLDMAVGVVVGGAFGKIISSLVDNIIMPLVGVLVGGINFSELAWKVNDNLTLNYGAFIQSLVDFFIIALCIFLVIRLIQKAGEKLSKKPEEAPAAPPAKPDDVVLLEEIRDLLKNQK